MYVVLTCFFIEKATQVLTCKDNNNSLHGMFFCIFFCFFVFLLFLTISWMTGFMTDGHSFYVGRLNPFQVCDIYR